MIQTAYVIDAYAQIYRAFYATPLMSNSKGVFTNAVFGFSRFLLFMEKNFSPAFGSVVFDKGRPTERIELLPDYKANRKPMPDELRSQIEILRKITIAFGYPLIEEMNREADDVIAGISQYFTDFNIRIISADKDIAQLINDRIQMLVPGTPAKGLVLRGETQVIEKFNITPAQIIDYLAMLGDAADNIPGLQGVGVKTAAKLLNEYSSIEKMLANPEIIQNPKLKQKIIDNAELLRKNIQLITLCPDLDDAYKNISTISKRIPDWDEIYAIARDLELYTLLKALDSYQKNLEKQDPNIEKKKQTASTSSEMYTPDMFS